MSARTAPPELVWLVALVALQVGLALIWVQPGPLSIDEVLYQTMARSAAEGHPLTVANGYEELPSPELATVDYMRTVGDRLTVQYPIFFPLLAAPLYRWIGPMGLFLLNAAAFAGVLVLTWRIGARLFGSRTALAGAAMLAVGTFAWDYAMAAWPHMLTLLLELAAFDLMLVLLLRERDDAPVGVALLAGALLGIAVGFRRDAVFFLPVVALPLLFADRPRVRALAAMALGALPPLALLGWLNWLRWGTWSPLSYGRVDPAGFRTLALVGALGLAALVVAGLPPVRRRLARALTGDGWKIALLVAAVFKLVLFVLPATSAYMLRMVDGVESLLFDLRGSATEVAGGRVFYFAVLYAGGVKKALLQSLPWLPVLIVCGALAWRDPARRRAVLLLLLPVAVYLGIQIFLNRHGGMSLNMRYFLPALPFLALLGAMAVEAIWQSADRAGAPNGSRLVALGVPVGAALLVWQALRPGDLSQPREAVAAALNAPLLLALVTAVAAIAWSSRREASRARSLALLAATAAALTWSACLAFDYDARWSRAVRAENLRRATEVAARVTPNSLLFGLWPDWHGTVPSLVDHVIVAYPAVDDYRDFRRLATYHLDAGRRVYAALDLPTWTLLEERGHLAGLEFRRVDEADGTVLELRRAPE